MFDTPKTVRVLYTEDETTQAMIVREYLELSSCCDYRVEWVRTLADAIERARSDVFDIALLDLNLTDNLEINTFDRFHEAHPALPVIILSGLADESLAITAIQRGAEDYVLKDTASYEQLGRTIRFAIERNRRRRLVANLEEAQSEFNSARDKLASVIGRLKDYTDPHLRVQA